MGKKRVEGFAMGRIIYEPKPLREHQPPPSAHAHDRSPTRTSGRLTGPAALLRYRVDMLQYMRRTESLLGERTRVARRSLLCSSLVKPGPFPLTCPQRLYIYLRPFPMPMPTTYRLRRTAPLPASLRRAHSKQVPMIAMLLIPRTFNFAPGL